MEMCIYQIKKHFSINVYSGLAIKKGIVIKKTLGTQSRRDNQ